MESSPPLAIWMALPLTDSPETASRASGQQPLPLRALLDALPGFALVARSSGAILFANKALHEACGWSDEARKQPRRVSTLVPAGTAALLLAPAGVAALRAPLRAAGDSAPLLEWSSRRVGADDPRLLITAVDVSRQARLEHYIVENQWFELAAALSGGLAHDFNNVLAAVLGLSELISLRLQPGHPLQEFTGKIGTSVEKAKSLVRRFSQFSRKSPGCLEAQPTALVCSELAALLAGFLPGSVTLATAISPETPWCRADRHAFDQIVLNCVNFLRWRLRTDTGSIRLSSGAAGADGRARVELTGSGAGLLGLKIEPLFALDLRPTTTAYDSAAGLFAARALAAQHGATLGLRRDDPRTITFVLDLPAAPPECG